MANPYIESRIKINRAFLIVFAVLISAAFTWGAIALPKAGWFVALPLNALAIALVVVGSRQRVASEGQRGGGLMILGGLLVVASIFITFAVGNATS